jgi:signal transduction histidine kinase
MLIRLFVVCILLSATANAQITKQIKWLAPQSSNVDSLEKAATTNNKSPESQLKTLFALEDSRFRYAPDKFGKSLSTIKKLAETLPGLSGKAAHAFLQGRYSDYIQKDRKTALQWYLKALTLFKVNNDTVGIIRACIDLTHVNTNNYGQVTGDTAQARLFAQQATSIAEKSGNAELIILAGRAMAGYYYALPNRIKYMAPLEALQKRTIQLARADKRLIGYETAATINLSAAYIEQGAYKKALAVMLPLLEKDIDSRPPNESRTFYVNLGQTYYYLGQYPQAARYLKKAMTIYPQTITLGEKSTIYSVLKAVYHKAMNYADSVATTNDSLFSIQTAQQINDLQTQYGTKAKEQENRLLHQKNEAIVARNNSYKVLLTVSLIALTLVGILSLALYRINKRLASLKKGRERLLAILAHDLRTPTVAFRDFTRMLHTLLAHKQYDDIERVTLEIQRMGTQTEQVLDNVLQWSNSLDGKYRHSPEQYDISKQLNELLTLYLPAAKLRQIALTGDIQSNLMVYADPSSIGLILRNLIDNALKFTPKTQPVSVKGCQTGASSIEIGFTNPTLALPRLNSMQSALYGIGHETVTDQQTGLGLALIGEFTRINQGIIDLSVDDSGQIRFLLSLPVTGPPMG